MKLSKMAVRVACATGPVLVAGWGHGQWAYHKSVPTNKNWVVTHIPTGLAIVCELSKMKEARSLCLHMCENAIRLPLTVHEFARGDNSVFTKTVLEIRNEWRNK